ncbi:MAG: hypothetical protein A2Z91_05530 [Deltaproteobacteria bacterium GWA2_38_16]|nr:MAG: hypothetical protein A2Z91_05530 [Deltaproteobacteria bacterium GWA2_38_16]OGQ03237.1 MAG: hypothetical protein A3D19_04255 [Deltaproteobacteria bacterium RIFCSPHIGHO2_02_FULL_38_15]OGQ34990.1 MAG: hypothetical protein A3A72_03305 [Deltaproteobacteria bacterium RIFCSPLOWO2_01_FULL_38_9]OGQ58755.1 MAG: hypothetical protein A3G92_04180 [Deltaproteobacteria bacterium RIFCSPLOWO2_12_FULL_38_8]HBQ21834.1 hypothetical protein [Deltaproteobacteria bacterium]
MFDFAHHMNLLIEDIVKKTPLFSHIKKNHRILISCAKTKSSLEFGTWAELYPMKYENGCYSIREREGEKVYVFKTDQLKIGRREILYILYFMMPRFQNLSYSEKLETIFHELYHVAPEFDGKLRQIHPRYAFHGPSIKLYDQTMKYWVRLYLRNSPNLKRHDFLKLTFDELKSKEDICLVYIPEPKETMRMMVSRRKKKR